MTECDPFTARLIEMRLKASVDEMATSVIRTSGSPAITEAKDFATALFDQDGELIGLGGHTPIHLGSSYWGLQSVIEAFGNDIEPGDGFIVNDPYTSGALHVGDVGIITPVFHESTQVAWAFANAHQVDIGGMSPGGLAAAASDCFSEGLMFPPTKIIVGGRLLREWRLFIANNVRSPTNVTSDILSLLAACVSAQRRVTQLIDDFGLASFRTACRMNLESAEKTVRARLDSLPDGTNEAVEWLDYDRGASLSVHKVRAEITKSGSNLHVDLSGSGEQAPGPVNTCRAGVYGTVYTAFAQKLAWDIPLNSGVFRPVTIDLGPEGTVVNARKPAPVSLGHAAAGGRITRAVSGVLTFLMQASHDDDVRAQISGTGAETFARASWIGHLDDGRYIAFLNQDQAPGLGARATGDGLDAGGYQFTSGLSITDIEHAESLYPMLYLWRRIDAHSAGDGFHKGGRGLDLAFTPRIDELRGTIFATGTRFPGRGELGGTPGGAGQLTIARGALARGMPHTSGSPLTDAAAAPEALSWEVLPSYGSGIRLSSGDIFRARSAGGGASGARRTPSPPAMKARPSTHR